MGAQATSVCIEMTASMDLGSADTVGQSKIKCNRSKNKMDGGTGRFRTKIILLVQV